MANNEGPKQGLYYNCSESPVPSPMGNSHSQTTSNGARNVKGSPPAYEEGTPLLGQSAAQERTHPVGFTTDDGAPVRYFDEQGPKTTGGYIHIHELGHHTDCGCGSVARRRRRSRCRALLKIVFLVGLAVLFWKVMAAKWFPTLWSPLCFMTPMKYTFTKTFRFSDLEHFKLYNEIMPSKRHHRFCDSFISIVPGGREQKDDIEVDFSFNTTEESAQDDLVIDATKDSLTIRFPKTNQYPHRRTPFCTIKSQTIVKVRPGLSMDYITVTSRVFSVNIPLPVNMTVTKANFTNWAGNFVAEPMFNARETFINVMAGHVRGIFPLFDLLSVHTDAGHQQLDVLPRTSDPEDVKPAVFVTTSQAGSIHAMYPPEHFDIPDRDYRVHVHSAHGSISGNYLHGRNTTLKASTGSIHAKILPYSADNSDSELTTETEAGSQMIAVSSPSLAGGKHLRRLAGNHFSKVGSLQVVYPPEWEGTVDVVSDLGSVMAEGPGLAIVKKSRQGIGMFIEAKKGESDALSLCKTTAGHASFRVGHE